MSKEYNDIFREIQKNHKDYIALNAKTTKNIEEIKRSIRILDQKISLILNKIQELEVIIDAAELIEDQMEDNEDVYNTEWSPYDDQDAEEFDDQNNENEENY